MKKRLFLLLLSVIMFIVPVFTSADGGGVDCGEMRSLNAGETKLILKTIRIIKAALPKAPQGWKLHKTDPVRNPVDKICSEKGSPAGYSFSAEYIHGANIQKNAQNFEQNNVAEKMEKLAEELNRAAAKNDMAKIQEIRQKMLAVQTGKANDMIANIRINVNFFNSIEGRDNSRRFKLPQAKFAYIQDDGIEKKIVLYLGSWTRTGEDEIYPKQNEKAANTSVQIMEIAITGSIAEELAKNLNFKALKPLF
jgi:hypothetical protein